MMMAQMTIPMIIHFEFILVGIVGVEETALRLHKQVDGESTVWQGMREKHVGLAVPAESHLPGYISLSPSPSPSLPSLSLPSLPSPSPPTSFAAPP